MPRNRNQMSGRGLLIFGLFWTSFSSIFLVIGLKLSYDGITRSGWPTTDCKVSAFSVDSKPDNEPVFQPEVAFTYSWQGETYQGDHVWINKEGEDDYEDLAELIQQHRNGELTRCHVNPEDPMEACLIVGGEDIWGGLIFAIFGGGFVAIGIGLIWGSRKIKAKEQAPLSSKASEKESESNPILIPFFLIFALAGLGTLIFLVIPQASKYQDAKSWKETPAEVIWSRVRVHTGDDSTTYSTDIFYRYQYRGQTYKSNTTGLFSGSSSGHQAKQDKVNAHPSGKKITCYVNPEKPWQAMLERKLGWSALFALFPLPFLAVGVGGLWWTLRQRFQKAKLPSRSAGASALRSPNQPLRHSSPASDPYHRKQGGSLPPGASQTFSPRGSRIKGVLGTLAFALIWNGIISIPATMAAEAWSAGKADWFLTLFIIPFILVGIGALGLFFYKLLALFNPVPQITLTPGTLTIGDNTGVEWNIPRRAERLQHFSLLLVGEEEARYRRGTNTVTDQSVFYEQVLFETSDPRQARRGSISINLPTHTVPSWESENNAIRWSLVVKGDIALWPDIDDTHSVQVEPVSIHPSH